MKQEFIDFLNALMAAAPEVEMSENVKAYIDTLIGETGNKPVLTDNGKIILAYLQEHQDKAMWKARDIAEGLFTSPRGVAGSLRKLANDGFVEKIGETPTIYSLTDKGKNFIIEE